MLNTKYLQNSILLMAGILLLCTICNVQPANAASTSAPAASSTTTAPPTTSTPAAPREVKLEWNGTRLPQNGLLVNGNTMIPIVLLRDSIGVTLRYEAAVKTYTLLQNDDQIDMITGASGITVRLNNHQWNGPSAQIIKGRMYVPFSVLRDGFGYQSSWNASQLTLNFAKKGIFLE
ncbi:stalk domain-containing protein [Paenibacillus sp. WLX2291]|uniref:stalk domain-containing protein n=1 Tax=Paenibacillus sp. WLX2291 TaxID=3296934 RepID=UPI0039844563